MYSSSQLKRKKIKIKPTSIQHPGFLACDTHSMPASLKGTWSISDSNGEGAGAFHSSASRVRRGSIYKANTNSWGAPVVGIGRQNSSPYFIMPAWIHWEGHFPMELVMKTHTDCSCRDHIPSLESQRTSGNCRLQQCLTVCHKNKVNVKQRFILQQKSPGTAKE